MHGVSICGRQVEVRRQHWRACAACGCLLMQGRRCALPKRASGRDLDPRDELQPRPGQGVRAPCASVAGTGTATLGPSSSRCTLSRGRRPSAEASCSRAARCARSTLAAAWAPSADRSTTCAAPAAAGSAGRGRQPRAHLSLSFSSPGSAPLASPLPAAALRPLLQQGAGASSGRRSRTLLPSPCPSLCRACRQRFAPRRPPLARRSTALASLPRPATDKHMRASRSSPFTARACSVRKKSATRSIAGGR